MHIGVLGSGQLGKMLALAGRPLGLNFTFFGVDPAPCAAGLGEVIISDFADIEQLNRFMHNVDVVTAESEHIPLTAIQHIEAAGKLLPAANAIEIAQDRLKEKQYIQQLDIPLPVYTHVDRAEVLQDLFNNNPREYIIKTCTDGYDGKGQMRVQHAGQIADVLNTLGEKNLIAEEKVEFQREVSQISVRSGSGEVRHYNLSENLHEHGILRTSTVLMNDPLAAQAREYSERILQALNYVGILCVEYFDRDGQLLVNEIAPRVHNSGHHTIEGAITSQFENHVRAVSGLPLGSCAARGYSCMINLIGEMPDINALLDTEAAHVHVYDKASRPGRKLGHVTVCADSTAELQNRIKDINKILKAV